MEIIQHSIEILIEYLPFCIIWAGNNKGYWLNMVCLAKESEITARFWNNAPPEVKNAHTLWAAKNAIKKYCKT